MGSSAAVMLGSRADAGEPFEHLIFDPHGLGSGRGAIVEAYLKEHFGGHFQRFWEHSAIGLARIWAERGPGSAGLIFIDGSHLFESVLTDFYLADRLCCVGGAIVFDDALFPAIETVIQYVIANRPDFEVHHLIADNATVAVRVDEERRSWDAFTPFAVPQRAGWSFRSPHCLQASMRIGNTDWATGCESEAKINRAGGAAVWKRARRPHGHSVGSSGLREFQAPLPRPITSIDQFVLDAPGHALGCLAGRCGSQLGIRCSFIAGSGTC